MEADADGLFDGYGIPPCPSCGTSAATSSELAPSERRCSGCGLPLKRSSELTAAWEAGDNSYAYITCADCGYQNPF
jgi:predicted nucleic-acid-binding Zn-ribbon protein